MRGVRQDFKKVGKVQFYCPRKLLLPGCATVTLAVPFYEFCKILKHGTDWVNVRAHLLDSEEIQVSGHAYERIRGGLNKFSAPPPAFEKLVAAIKATVFEDQYHVPAILIQKEGELITPERLGSIISKSRGVGSLWRASHAINSQPTPLF